VTPIMDNNIKNEEEREREREGERME